MTKRCLDEGLLQAYMDGELPQERAAEAAAHVAACDACAAALAEAEGELSFFSAAFAADDSVSVPTEVLRSRIGAAVAQLESSAELTRRRSGRNFGGFLASLSSLFTFTPQRAAAFASLLAAVAVGIIYFAVIKQRTTTVVEQPAHELARNETTNDRPNVATPTPTTADNPDDDPAGVAAPTPEKGSRDHSIVNAGHRPRARVRSTDAAANTAAAAKPQLLPGEKDYKEAIASLEQTIKMGGDSTLKPSVRVDYERNIAILDSAIAQTRQVAAQNPKDKDAVGFLMSAYQSKVELLTKVADQTQVAALGR